ncbi:hypothetical protein IE53DRAFT_339988 [Violaceomyces palustris]|uniref:Uncharacterized protein n=1 Tax=Violaceomyces palustris TaxID=1673888 RepID=A0ACD0P3Y7_9BASI|nr:hypothetical protein IE53DRAFT_339988 [Violaceomyces palustris]
MPLKLPLLPPSQSLQERGSILDPRKIWAQIVVLSILLLLGAFNHFVLSKSKSRNKLDENTADRNGYKEEILAEVDSIFVYPVKSCFGYKLQGENQILSKGFELDRRWMIVAKGDADGAPVRKISLREDNRLTLIRTELDFKANLLRLSISKNACRFLANFGEDQLEGLPPIFTPLYPTSEERSGWQSLRGIEMWGDKADAKVVEVPKDTDISSILFKGQPSDWLSKFLGYQVQLVHFDSTSKTQRKSFPIYKTPTDYHAWSSAQKSELERERGIEFQDEYPFLVTTIESLEEVRSQVRDAVRGSKGEGTKTDGRGGRPIGGLDVELWDSETSSGSERGDREGEIVESLVRMARFRPNIVLRSINSAFDEDSWEKIVVLPSEEEAGHACKLKEKAILQFVSRCERCLLTSVDPETSRKDKAVPLKFLSRNHLREKKHPLGDEARSDERRKKLGPCFGMYAIPLPGEVGSIYGSIKVGDKVNVYWRPYAEDDEPRGAIGLHHGSEGEEGEGNDDDLGSSQVKPLVEVATSGTKCPSAGTLRSRAR